MQLAASISKEGENIGENAIEEENEDDEDDISRYGFYVRCKFHVKNFIRLLVTMFTIKFAKKCYRLLKHITIKDFLFFIIILFYRSGKSIIKFVWKLLLTVVDFLMTYLFSGSLIELAKETTISGFIESIPEPTQDGIGSRFEDEPEDEAEEEIEEDVQGKSNIDNNTYALISTFYKQ